MKVSMRTNCERNIDARMYCNNNNRRGREREMERVHYTLQGVVSDYSN